MTKLLLAKEFVLIEVARRFCKNTNQINFSSSLFPEFYWFYCNIAKQVRTSITFENKIKNALTIIIICSHIWRQFIRKMYCDNFVTEISDFMFYRQRMLVKRQCFLYLPERGWGEENWLVKFSVSHMHCCWWCFCYCCCCWCFDCYYCCCCWW